MSIRQVPLAEIAVIKGLIGGPFGSSLVSSDYEQAGVPVIRGTNLGHGKYVDGEFAFVSEEKVARDLSRNIAIGGDVVFTQRGTLGQVALVPRNGFQRYVISQSQMRLRVEPAIATPDFLFYACSSVLFQKQVADNAISTGVPHINLGILGRLTIPLPAIHEQRAITEVLGALDDKINANTNLAAAAEELAVASLAGELAMVRLRDAVCLHRNTVSPDSIDERTVDHFSLPAFDAGVLPTKDSPRDIRSAKFRLDRPVVLLSKLNPRFPRVWSVESLGSRPALASTEFLVLEPRNSTTAALWAALSQPAFSLALDAKVSGTSGSHQRVKPDDALNTLIVDPSAISPDRSALVTNVVSLAGRARRESRNLAATRDALLPQLMSGKLRVKDAEKVLEGVL